MRARLERLLSMPGVHFLATRFGGPMLRALSFDQKYIDGEWDADYHSPEAAEITALMQRYARKGDILDLGCGTALFVDLLAPNEFSSYVGVDLSREAIAKARERRSGKATFVVADIATYPPDRSFDLIIFRESLYYIPARQRLAVLLRYARCLKPEGVFVVTVQQRRRFAGMIDMIRGHFRVLEDRRFSDQLPCLLVFR